MTRDTEPPVTGPGDWPVCPVLFRYDKPVVATACAEPCIVLLENDVAFSVLFAESAEEKPASRHLRLEEVCLLRVKGKGWRYERFGVVEVRRQGNGLWLVEDTGTSRIFHEPSEVPYHVIFIDERDFARLHKWRDRDVARPVFEYAQRLFGMLPGFSVARNVLTTPARYASAEIPGTEFVCAK